MTAESEDRIKAWLEGGPQPSISDVASLLSDKQALERERDEARRLATNPGWPRIGAALVRANQAEFILALMAACAEDRLRVVSELAEGERHWCTRAYKAEAALTAKRVRAEGLEGALTELCDQIADTELHGDGAHDDGCPICIAHQDARALLTPTPRSLQGPGIGGEG